MTATACRVLLIVPAANTTMADEIAGRDALGRRGGRRDGCGFLSGDAGAASGGGDCKSIAGDRTEAAEQAVQG